jgi:hypothetical protein
MPQRKKPPKDSGGDEVVVHQSPLAPEPHPRLALFRALEALRAAVGAVLDLADAAAEALARRI